MNFPVTAGRYDEIHMEVLAHITRCHTVPLMNMMPCLGSDRVDVNHLFEQEAVEANDPVDNNFYPTTHFHGVSCMLANTESEIEVILNQRVHSYPCHLGSMRRSQGLFLN